MIIFQATNCKNNFAKNKLMKILKKYIGLLCLIFLFCNSYSQSNRTSEKESSAIRDASSLYEARIKRFENNKIGKTFPKFDFKLFKGDIVNSEKDFMGGLVVLNFWFANCQPCLEEMPNLNSLVQKYASNSKIKFYAISFDDSTTIANCLITNKFDFQIGMMSRNLIDSLGITAGYPTSYIINKELKVIDATVGCNFNMEVNKCDLKSKYELIIDNYLKGQAEHPIKK